MFLQQVAIQMMVQVKTPIKTIGKLNTISLNPGDTVLFKKGDKFSGTINVGSSGTSINPITFGAYGTGDKPIIAGTRDVSGGWTLHSGNVYKKTVSGDVKQVFVDGVRLRPARYPKTGYLFTTTGTSNTTIVASGLPADDYTGCRIIIRTYYFTIDAKTVTNSSGTNFND